MFSIGNLCNCVPAEVQMYGHIKKKDGDLKGKTTISLGVTFRVSDILTSLKLNEKLLC